VARPRWCSAIRARSTRWFTAADTQPCSTIFASVPRNARPTPGLTLFSSPARRCADMTAASGMARSALEQHPIPLDGNVCCRATRDFCVAWLTGSRIFPFRRSGLFCVLERVEPQLAARPPPLAASSQRQEPRAPRATAGRCCSRWSLVHTPSSSTSGDRPPQPSVWCRQPFGAVLYLQGQG
jgi:hypothetical protein